MLLEVFVVGIVLVILLKFIFIPQTQSNVSEKQSIPGLAPSHPEEGNWKEIKDAKTMSIFLNNLHEKFGPIACFWMGKKMAVTIASPEFFKELRRIFETPRDTFEEFQLLTGPHSLLHSEPEEAKRRRKIYDHHFMMRACKSYTQCFHEISQDISKNWKSLPPNAQIPLLSTMTRASMGSLARTTFGDHFKNENNLDVYHKLFDYLCKNVDPPPEPGTEEMETFLKKSEQMKTIVQGILDERRNATNKDSENRLLIDVMLEEDLTDEERLADAALFVAIGYFITAGMMTWGIYELSRHPEIQEKLHQELVEVLGDKPLTLENMPKLIYTRQVIDEAIRIHIKGGYGARVAQEDMKLGNYHIPKGTSVYQAIGYLCNDANIWPQPEKFDPDRFNPENSRGRNPYAFKPFGYAGKRVCPAQAFAYSEITIFYAEWFRHFRFHLVPNQQIQVMEGVMMAPEEEILVTIEHRATF